MDCRQVGGSLTVFVLTHYDNTEGLLASKKVIVYLAIL